MDNLTLLLFQPKQAQLRELFNNDLKNMLNAIRN